MINDPTENNVQNGLGFIKRNELRGNDIIIIIPPIKKIIENFPQFLRVS